MEKKIKNFKIAVVQMAMDDNPDANVQKAKSFVNEAAENDAKIVCLPELFKSRYFCQSENIKNFSLAEKIPGKTTGEFGRIAKEKRIDIILPLFEKRAAGIYHNSVAFINEGGNVEGIYRKMHIPDDPGFYEKFYFTPGDLGYQSFNTEYGKIGSLICWDQWFPEAARLTALMGASIIFYPTAIGWLPFERAEHGKSQFEAWLNVQRGHAIANGVYVAAANRVGFEKVPDDAPGIEFWGQSFICDPQGVILAQASVDKEEIIYANVDIKKIEKIRQYWPFLRDRRIDSYENITKRFID